MTATAGDALQVGIDTSPLKARYWATLTLIVLQLIAEIFDFFVVGYLVSAVAPLWRLTFGQTTIILLSAGLGAIVGAMALGWVADLIGRKTVVVLTGVMCAICASAIALVPEGAWLAFAGLRFLVGFGYGGAGASQFALVVEYTPAPRRTLIASGLAIPAGLGVLLASVVVSNLFPILGWRGTAALGIAPILFAGALAFVAPESARWLLSKGRTAQARRAAESMSRLPPNVSDSEASASAPAPAPAARPPGLALLSSPRRFWLIVLVQVGIGSALTGVLLWGPTILAQLLRITPQQAAADFVGVSLVGMAGRIVFALAPTRFGRVLCGQAVGYGGFVMLALAAVFHGSQAFGAPLFFVFLLLAQFFVDGGTANANTYGAELYPVRLAAQGAGLSAAAGGGGKLIGPLVLGLIAGTGNLVSPHATEQAVEPAFLFLSGCCLMVGLAYTLLGIETHGRALTLE